MKTLLLFLWIFLNPCLAQINPQPTPSPTPTFEKGFAVGIGLVERTQLFKAEENDTFPLPFLSWKADDFYIKGLNFGYYIHKAYPQFNFIIQPTMLEVDNEEGTYNEALGKRYRTLNAGFEFLLPTPWFLIALIWHHDFLDVHRGWMTSLELKKKIIITEKISLSPTIGAFFYDSSYVDYYFGVDNDEVRSNRPYYEPGSTITWGPSLTTNYILNQSWSLILFGKYIKYASQVKNSPLVKRDDQFRFMFGASKSFD